MNSLLRALLLLLFITCSGNVFAKPDFIYLDATKNKSKAIDAYRRAIQEFEGSKLRLRIYLRVDAYNGFDAGHLRLDPNVKYADIRITVRIVNGRRIRKDIVINALDLSDNYTLFSINQEINIY